MASYCVFETDNIALLGVKLESEKEYQLATYSEPHKDAAAKLFRKARYEVDDPYAVFMNIKTGMVSNSKNIGDTHRDVALIAAQPLSLLYFISKGCRNQDIHQDNIPIFHNGVYYSTSPY